MNANYAVRTDMGVDIPVHVTRFPTGEVAVKLDIPRDGKIVVSAMSVRVQGYEPDTLFILANIKDALDNTLLNAGLSKKIEIRLFMPFMPHARYDRHMVTDDGFALRVFCDMLNLLKFDRVMVIDPHSDATTAMVNNIIAKPQDKIMLDMFKEFNVKPDVLVAPDAGAYKKIFKLSQQMKLPVVTLTKVRDLATGKILGTKMLDELPRKGCHCLIVDDLCDGGRTFIGAAEVLREAGAEQVDLAVTHGIFSAGLSNLLDNGIDHLYTTDSYKTLDTEDWNGLVNQFTYF